MFGEREIPDWVGGGLWATAFSQYHVWGCKPLLPPLTGVILLAQPPDGRNVEDHTRQNRRQACSQQFLVSLFSFPPTL